MDKDRVAGAAIATTGTAELAGGKAVGDARLQSIGEADKAKGAVQNAFGGRRML